MAAGSRPPAAPAPNAAAAPNARTADPCVIVILGGSGDLTRRKLIPAVLNLQAGGFLPRNLAVVGVARSAMSAAQFRDAVRPDEDALSSDGTRAAWADLSERIFYHSMNAQEPDAYTGLSELLARIDTQLGTAGNYLFYFAVSPSFFSPIVQNLAASGLTREERGHHWRRIVIEKPFGHDLSSAIELNQCLRGVVREGQIFRIDHYLGKETVQNLMVFRFGNGLFEPIWNRNYIDHVQITVAEELGVEGRGGYYDGAGAMRDMTPNHIAQLISLVAMEPPISFSADAVRDEQVKLLKSVEPLSPEEVLQYAVRGQYGAGQVDGARVPAYRDEEKVAQGSPTETFVALRLMIDNWRWAGVPIYVRTGKRLPRRVTEIVIQFKHAPATLFQHTSVQRLTTNRLCIHIQPREGITLRFGAKIPGPVVSVGSVEMDFDYADHFGKVPSTGYETLLYEVMIGDATLFQRADMVETGWNMVQPILDVWGALKPRTFPNYVSGTWGPAEADALLEREGRHWDNFGA
ncbi:MAG TPA: glucose-6-phosphate dehydrogenase [Kofleriaceae bacterium]|nr:glucose-6-phosphate dehydrogenase [Kofleriaceae bacterium]